MINVQQGSKVFIQKEYGIERKLLTFQRCMRPQVSYSQTLPGFQKGKQRPLQVLRMNQEYQEAFNEMGSAESDENSVFLVLEERDARIIFKNILNERFR